MALGMQDRLSDLKLQSQHQQHSGSLMLSPDDTELVENSTERLQMQHLFATVNEIAKLIDQMIGKMDEIANNHCTILLSCVDNTGAKMENRQLADEVKALTVRVHGEMRRLKEEIETEEQDASGNVFTAHFRIKKAQYATLSRRFCDVMSYYNEMQDKYREKNKEGLRRKLDYCGRGDVTDGQVEEMLESDDPNIFGQDLLISTTHERDLSEAEARYKEILFLEEDIKELYEMFVDMTMLVEEQGELINNIECNVQSAQCHVTAGARALRTAVPFKRSSQKMRYIICGCVTCSVVTAAAVLAVVLAVVITTAD